jgi:5'-3' exonuclease
MCYEQHGVEADDIAGTIAKMASKENDDVTLYTSDKDYLQFIDKNVKVSLLKVGLSNMELLDEEGMKAKFGFTPKQIIDYKGLRGDDSDNLHGIPGVGDKTAVKLIQKYGDFETILSKADEIGGKLGENLKDLRRARHAMLPPRHDEDRRRAPLHLQRLSPTKATISPRPTPSPRNTSSNNSFLACPSPSKKARPAPKK